MITTLLFMDGPIKLLLTTVIVLILIWQYIKAYLSILCQFSVQNEFVQSSTEEVNILKTDVSIDLQELPEVIPPPGIPPERQKYLYKQIRMFCEPEYTDITCPQPESNSETDQLAAIVEESNCLPTKRARLCSHCRRPGHTKTVCGKIMCPALLS